MSWTRPRLSTVSAPPRLAFTGAPVAYPPLVVGLSPPPHAARPSAPTRAAATSGLRTVILVQRLPGQLPPTPVEQHHLEEVRAVVVGRDQREALLGQRALIHGEVGQLGGHDGAPADQRAAPHQGDRRLFAR